MECIFSHSGSILSLLKFLLSLAELCQVQGSNLLSFLNLLLVGLDLALSSLVSLGVLSSAGLDISKLNLKLTDAGLKLSHGRLSTTHSSIIGISKTVLKFSKLGLKGSLTLGQGGGVVLLRSELISKTGSINHGLLGLLLRVLGLVEEVINLSLHGVKRSLNTSLVSTSSGIDGVHLIDSIA